MRYLSLDIETTGLNENTCQILQFAAILDDTSFPLEAMSTFNALIYSPMYVGEPFALALNRPIFETLSKSTLGRDTRHLGRLVHILDTDMLVSYLKNYLSPLKFVVVAGKNVANFDLKFLSKIPSWSELSLFHRVLDPGNLYLRPTDLVPPGTEECLRRAGLDDFVSHDALDDALSVCKLIRHWEKNYGN
jgi:oligoribonuclease